MVDYSQARIGWWHGSVRKMLVMQVDVFSLDGPKFLRVRMTERTPNSIAHGYRNWRTDRGPWPDNLAKLNSFSSVRDPHFQKYEGMNEEWEGDPNIVLFFLIAFRHWCMHTYVTCIHMHTHTHEHIDMYIPHTHHGKPWNICCYLILLHMKVGQGRQPTWNPNS